MDPSDLQQLVITRVLAWRTSLPEGLLAPLDRMLRARGYLLVDQLPDYMGARATPLLGLPRWVADTLRADGHALPGEVVVDAAEAALTGYFLIRLHDDHCDEGTGDPIEVLMLASALQARMAELFARVAPRASPFWPLATEVFSRYGDAMILEHRLLRGEGIQDAASFSQILPRYDPLLLPGAAVLAHVDDWRMLGPLRDMIGHLAASVQLFNDAFDALPDLRHGNRTWAVCRYGPEGDGHRLTERLIGEGGLSTLVDEAIAAAGRARDVAITAGLHGAPTLLAARMAAMDAARDALFDTLLAELLVARP